MTLKGIHLPKDGTVLPCQAPISLHSLQLKGQKRVPPNLQKVDSPLMPLPLGKAQLLLMSPNFLKHLLLTLWSLNLPTLTFNLDHLSLMCIG